MNVRNRLTELIQEYHSFVEPYERIHSRNPQDLALKLEFCRAGEKMCGGPHQFALWFVFTFSPETLYNVPPEEYDQHTGKVMANIPRAMYGPILGYMNYISSFDSLVLPTTLEWWWKVGLYRFPDFIDRHSGIIAGETLFRTRFPNRMTQHEAMHMILLWLPSNKRQPATQPPPEPFIHAPMVLCLPEPSVQVVALLPAVAESLLAVPEAINEPVITVAVHEVDIPFKEHIDRAAVGDAMGWSEEDYIKPLYTRKEPIFVEAKPPKPHPTALYALRHKIRAYEKNMLLSEKIVSRRKFFGQGNTDLNNVPIDQLAAYARELGVEKTVVNAILADHAREQFGDGSERRLAS